MSLTETASRLIRADLLPAPSAWLQWKGTEVCMDVLCTCGAQGHIDADFTYYYACKACGKVFQVGASIRLYELTPEEAEEVREKMPGCVVEGGPRA